MKTVLTEILDYLHLDKNYEEINENLQVHDIVYKINDLLKKEKQQIIDAYNQGDYPNGEKYDSGLNYFKETYENK